MAKEKEIAIIVDTVRKIDLKQKQLLVILKQSIEKGNDLQMKKKLFPYEISNISFAL